MNTPADSPSRTPQVTSPRKMPSLKGPRRAVLFAGAASIATLAVAGALLRPANADPADAEGPVISAAVTVATPLVESITEWDEYSGRFVASESVEIRSRVSGYLAEVAFEDGAIVSKGDLLFRIDPRPFQAELAAAEAGLTRARAIRDNAVAEEERGARLLERQALSAEEAGRRKRMLQEAEAEVTAAKARLTEARLNLEFTEIRAPITGRISDDFISQGNLVNGGAQGGTLLTTLVATSPIEFEFATSEADFLRYRRLEQDGARESGPDAAHTVFVRLMDEERFETEGTLSFVNNQLDRSTGTMRGRATFDNADDLFTPGMFGRLRLAGSAPYDAVMIPDTAVQTDQTQNFVWLAGTGEVAERRNISLGPLVNGLRVVRDGLSGDERVIVSGTQFVQPGASLAAHDAGPVRYADLQESADHQ